MSEVVIDASACLSWVLKSQRTDTAVEFLVNSDDKRFFAPFIFSWETQNVILGLHRRKALSEADYDNAMITLAGFDIEIGPPFSSEMLEPLARKERLSLFDTAYLAAAIERDSALASRDADLLIAAARLGVQTWDLR